MNETQIRLLALAIRFATKAKEDSRDPLKSNLAKWEEQRAYGFAKAALCDLVRS